MQYSSTDNSIDRINASTLAAVKTSLPGYIETYDPKKKTCTVNLALTEFKDTDGAEPLNFDLRPIPTPVKFPRGGGFCMTWPLKKGDPVWVVFCHRQIDEWFASDGKTKVTAALLSLFESGDCYVDPGAFPEGNNKGEATDRELIISSDDGTQLIIHPDKKVTVVGDKFEIGARGASNALAISQTVDSHFTAIQVKLDIVLAIFGIPIVGLLSSTASGKAFTND
jgi:hypothetical protein